MQKRIKKIQDFLAQEKIDGLLVLNPSNRYYLSKFELKDVQYNESAGFLIVTLDDVYLFTDSRYFEEARRYFEQDKIFIYAKDKFNYIRDRLKNKLKISTLGFEYYYFPYEFYDHLSGSFDLVPTKYLIEKIRQIKDERELDKIITSNKLVSEVFDLLPSYFQEGQTEQELAWFIEKFFREKGALELAFPSIVAFGQNAAKPHALPSARKLKKNEVILIDIGCRFQDYCSDQTRTFWFGDKPSTDFTFNFNLVVKAQEKAINFIQPGREIREAYFLVKDFFKSYGVDQYFTHALGHGIGLDTHELPSITPKNENKFEPGMVITIEPGLYYPEWGGIRQEYMVLVTEKGARII